MPRKPDGNIGARGVQECVKCMKSVKEAIEGGDVAKAKSLLDGYLPELSKEEKKPRPVQIRSSSRPLGARRSRSRRKTSGKKK
jgi:hypothetical protein